MVRGSATTDDQFAYFTPYDSNSVYIYNWSTNEWNKLSSSPYRNSGLVIIDGELTAVGGQEPDKSTGTNKVVTLKEKNWVERYPSMKHHVFSAAVVSYNTDTDNYIFVIGPGDCWTSTVELFHTKTKLWYNVVLVPPPCPQPSATICGNELHVIGVNRKIYSCSVQSLLQSLSNEQVILDTKWTGLPQLPVAQSTLATLHGELVIVGGKEDNSSVNSIYQLVDEKWEKIGSMERQRMECLVVTPVFKKMMIVGGVDGDSTVEECVVVKK